ncbi:MAG: hypothetical protein HKP29_02585, partial [Silicimonas sp.]|nr:hypothetical protein [Silicimonas sp.]
MSNDTINGGDGNDTVFAGSGNDLISGGNGDDVIYDGAGNDTIFGNADHDTFYLGTGASDGSDVVDGGTGIDTIIEDLSSATPGSTSIYVNLTTGTHFRQETPGTGVDTLQGIENFTLIGPVEGTIIGSSVANLLTSDAGDDSLNGFAGDDTLSSGDGADTLIGGAGADLLYAGDGDDLIFVDDAGDIVDGGAGSDRVIVDTVSGLGVTIANWTGVERISGAAGNDTLDATGVTSAMLLQGAGGADNLVGGL